MEDGKNFEEHSKKNKGEDERVHSGKSKTRRLSAREMLTPADVMGAIASH